MERPRLTHEPRGRRDPLPSEASARGIVLAEATMDIGAPPEAVWALWLDVKARPRWHPRLEWARLEGPASPGTRGAWKPAGTRPVSVVITELEPQRRLVLRGTHGPPIARGHYEHEVHPLPDGGSRVTHRMRLSGLMARPIGRLLGRALGAFATPAALAVLADQLGGEDSTARR